MSDTKMDSAIKKLRGNGYRIEVFGPSPEGRFMIGVNGELKTYDEVYELLADLEVSLTDWKISIKRPQ